MTEDEMQSLRDMIVDSVDQLLGQYDWDRAFAKYLEGQ